MVGKYFLKITNIIAQKQLISSATVSFIYVYMHKLKFRKTGCKGIQGQIMYS